MTLTSERKQELIDRFGEGAPTPAAPRSRWRCSPSASTSSPSTCAPTARITIRGGPADARRPPAAVSQLPAAHGSRALPVVDPRARPASVSTGAPGVRSPRVRPPPSSRCAGRTEASSRRADLLGRPHGAGLLPVRLQPGLHRPALALQRGARRVHRAGRDAVRRLLRRRLQPDRVSRAAERRDRAAVGLRAQGRDVPGVRGAASGGLPAARAGARRARRGRLLELSGLDAGRPARART